ncbi:MAG: hypothetical protein WCK70_03515 [Chloroflexales bacterium]|jgi:hypothetical protein
MVQVVGASARCLSPPLRCASVICVPHRAVEGGAREGHLRFVYRQGFQPAITICCTIVMSSPDRCSLMMVSEPPERLARESLMLTAIYHPLGGRLVRRWWFVCPDCACKRAALFLHSGCWRCRCCAHLTYRSSCASDTRLGVHLRAIAEDWLGDGSDSLAALIADLLPLTEGAGLHASRAALISTQALRLRHKASQLARRRLARGVPLYRERPGSDD